MLPVRCASSCRSAPRSAPAIPSSSANAGSSASAGDLRFLAFRPSPPHPVVAPVTLPTGQSAFAELQEETVVVREQSAAADVAERQIDFVAGPPADVAKRFAQRACHIVGVHPER